MPHTKDAKVAKGEIASRYGRNGHHGLGRFQFYVSPSRPWRPWREEIGPMPHATGAKPAMA